MRRQRDPAAEALRLHRARRDQETRFRDSIFAVADTGISLALAALARAKLAAAHHRPETAAAAIDEARRTLLQDRAVLRAAFDQFS